MNDAFHIHFERMGGFMAITTQVDVDSDSIDANEVDKLTKMISDSGFFDTKVSESEAKNLPDQFNYILMIEQGGRSKKVEFTEATMPSKWKPLVDYLIQKSRNRR